MKRYAVRTEWCLRRYMVGKRPTTKPATMMLLSSPRLLALMPSSRVKRKEATLMKTPCDMYRPCRVSEKPSSGEWRRAHQ